MRIINLDIKKVKYLGNISAAIGYFDGVHVAHQKLIKTCVDIANENHNISTVITFEPDPWTVIKPNKVGHLQPNKEKFKIFKQLGIELVINFKFNKELLNTSAVDFIKVLEKLGVVNLICGYDFKFGYQGEGNINDLQTTEFTTTIVNEITDGGKISSTSISKLITNGEITKANKYLSRNYQITGIVAHGKKNGRKIGFKTINLDLDFDYVIPQVGVYGGRVKIGRSWYAAIISIGSNPTFGNNPITIEAHLDNFNRSVYNKRAVIEFDKYLRAAKKFSSIAELVKQLNIDKQYFNK
ncbi:MAG: riboflavin biosynthesis protein RibF [Erysipelotrichaceae bacterium]